jgi:hypothetical protein
MAAGQHEADFGYWPSVRARHLLTRTSGRAGADARAAVARRSARGTVALALALALGIGIGAMGAAAGCGGASGGSTNPTPTDETTTVQGVAFRHPAGWTSKEDIGSDGTGSVQLGPSSPTGSRRP